MWHKLPKWAKVTIILALIAALAIGVKEFIEHLKKRKRNRSPKNN